MENSERVNFIGFACGIKGGGKSWLLSKWASRFPRRIILDTVCEYFDGVYPGAHECLTLDETVGVLGDLAAEETDRWTVVTCLSAKDTIRLFGMLAPVENPRGGYAVNVGGVLLECGECETFMPNHAGIADEAANLIHRGRHSRVSLALGTRRPRDVSRLLTSQADVVGMFRQNEARDVDYLASITKEAVGPRIRTLGQWHHVQYLPGTGAASVIDPDGNTIERIVDELLPPATAKAIAGRWDGA